MKKIILPLIIMTLFFLVGCSLDNETGEENVSSDNSSSEANAAGETEETGGEGEEAAAEAAAEVAEESNVDLSGESISVATGSESGSVYPMGVQVSQYLSSLGAVSVNTSGAAVSNLELVNSGEMDIGHSSTAVGTLAAEGRDPFEDELTNLRSIASLSANYFQIAVNEDLEFETLEEIIQAEYPLELGVREPGSEGELAARLVLEAYGVTYEDIEEWGGTVQFGSNADITGLLRDGHIEAGASLTSLPSPVFTEVDFQNPLKVLPLSDEVVATLGESGFVEDTVPAGSYEGQEEDAQIVSTTLILAAHQDVSDEVVYEIARYVSDVGVEPLAAIASDYEEFLIKNTNNTPEATSSNLPGTIHPGAEHYYKEVGVME